MIAKYLIENRHIGVKLCRHGFFMFNKNDTFIGRGLDIYGEWCELEIALLAQVLRPGATIIDVGANVGTHTVALAKITGPDGVVHAFEPQRRLFQMLCGNVALNTLENVHCHQECVGAIAGEMSLGPLPPADRPANFGAVPVTANPAGERVRVTTIDELRLTSCALIKIDAEGMEADVISGAKDTIAGLTPVLFVENNSVAGARRVNEAIATVNYRAYWHIVPYFNPDNYFANPTNVWGRVAPEANLICFPRAAGVTTALPEWLGADDDWMKALARQRDSRPNPG